MSYSDEWLKARHNAEMRRAGLTPHADEQPKSVEPVPTASTTWKPWAQMTAEERRKALDQHEDATPRPKAR